MLRILSEPPKYLLLDGQEVALTPELAEEIKKQNTFLAQQVLRDIGSGLRRLDTSFANKHRSSRRRPSVPRFWPGLWIRCAKKPNQLYSNAASPEFVPLASHRRSSHHNLRHWAKLGLTDGAGVLTGSELDELTPAELSEKSKVG